MTLSESGSSKIDEKGGISCESIYSRAVVYIVKEGFPF